MYWAVKEKSLSVESAMQYPIELKFKILTFGQRITATDAQGNVIMFIKQKIFKLKEQVDVYSGPDQNQLIFTIRADRILDFSANYHFADAEGNDWGSVRRQGMRSLWKAHYDVIQDGEINMTMSEESPFKKILESLFGDIPLLGILAIYLINPTYLISRPDGTPLLRLTKKPAFLEGKFVIEKLSDMPEDDELRSLLAILMAALLERRRG